MAGTIPGENSVLGFQHVAGNDASLFCFERLRSSFARLIAFSSGSGHWPIVTSEPGTISINLSKEGHLRLLLQINRFFQDFSRRKGHG
jgi:hypothetical protein